MDQIVTEVEARQEPKYCLNIEGKDVPWDKETIDDLVGAGLVQTERHGRERHIRFQAEGRHLFDAAHDLLRSPVRTEKFIRDVHAAPLLKRAGESALAELTDLSPPPLPLIGRVSPRCISSSTPTGNKLPISWKPGHMTRLPCLPRAPWIRCRSMRSSAITAMSAYPWRRNDCWTECRGNRNRQVSRTLRGQKPSPPAIPPQGSTNSCPGPIPPPHAERRLPLRPLRLPGGLRRLASLTGTDPFPLRSYTPSSH